MSLNKSNNSLLVLVLISWLLPTLATAEKLSIGTIATWPPFMYKEKNEVKGIATDIVRAALKKSGVSGEIKTYSWARAYQLAQTQKNFVIYILYKTPVRENQFKWAGPLVEPYKMYFYKLKERKELIINSLDDAKRYRVGVVRNVTNHKFLLSMGFKEGKNLEAVNDPLQNIRKLNSNRIDLLISNEYSLPILMKNLNIPFQKVEKVYSVLESESGYMGFNKQTPDTVIIKIQQALDQLKKEGVIKSITDKYINEYK